MKIRCPHCRRTVTVPDAPDVRRGRCEGCGRTIDLRTLDERDILASGEGGPSPGEVLGGCRIDGLLERSGATLAYRATQLSLGRPVVVKVVAPHLARDPHWPDRFTEGAAALAQVAHPNVVQILARGTEGDACYVVLEDVGGESLRTRLGRQGRLPLGEAAELLGQVADALEAAHARGVVHGDLRPESILFSAAGVAKLSDFRIGPAASPDGESAARLSDIRALGAILYETLTGQLAERGGTPPSQLVAGLPEAIDAVVGTALGAETGERFQTAAQFRAALEAAAHAPEPVRAEAAAPRRAARRRSSPLPILAAMLVILAGVGAVVWHFASRRREARGGKAASPPLGTQGSDHSEGDSAASAAREEAARAALDQARRLADSGKWRKAEAALDRLKRDYADTELCASDGVRSLARRIRDGLRARAAPRTRTAGRQPEQDAEPEPEPTPPPAPTLAWFHGVVCPLPDGRVELRYEWRDPRQLGDWEPRHGASPRVAEGEVQLGEQGFRSIAHKTSFIGDIELAGVWRIRKALDARQPWCGVGLCSTPRNRYRLMLAERAQWVNRRRPSRLRRSRSRIVCAAGQSHTFRFVRAGSALRASVNGRPAVNATDSALTNGRVDLGAQNAQVAYGKVRIVGRIDPAWLERNPEAAAQLAALTLYVQGIQRLRPPCAKREYAQALTEANALAATQDYAKLPQVAKWIIADAQALASLWQAVEAGAASLTPGQPFRLAGVKGEFVAFGQGTLSIHVGDALFPKRLADLRNEELIEIAQRSRDLATGPDHVALALLWLLGPKPDPARALAELAAAQEAGVDVYPHRSLIPTPPEKPKEPPPAKPTPRRWPTYAGSELLLGAADAPECLKPMQRQRDRTAPGGSFALEPRQRGQDKWAGKTGRLVFHVNVKQTSWVHIWARVRSPSQDANSLRLAVEPGEVTDSDALSDWHVGVRQQWSWEPFAGGFRAARGGRRPTPIRLEPGVNSIIVAARERGTALAGIRLSPATPPRPRGRDRR